MGAGGQALNDNSLAVVRAMRRFRNEAEQEQVERVLTSYEDGSFLIDRLGAGLVVDQDLAVVLLNLRRRLIRDARGPRGSGSDPRRTEPGGRTTKARQDLSDVRTASTGLSTRAAAA